MTSGPNNNGKTNLHVSVAETTGKSVEDREAAVRASGVAKTVADALARRRRSIYVCPAERDQIARMRDLGLVPGLLDVIDRLEALSEERLEQLEACEVQRNAAENAHDAVRKERDQFAALVDECDTVRATLMRDLSNMTDRYHEASNEADVLRDRIDHAGAYVTHADAAKMRALAELQAKMTAAAETPAGKLPDEPVVNMTGGMTRAEVLAAVDAELKKRGAR